MAPQIGPKDAPTIWKNVTRFAATPVMARITATVTPNIVDDMRGTPGIIVEKLLPAMNAQKQAGVTEANANRKNMALASHPPMEPMTAPKSQLASAGLSPLAPATASNGNPPAYRIGSAIPIKPPHLTSPALRLFNPKSAPAAPAVAKKPITMAISPVTASIGDGSGTLYCEIPPAVLKKATRIIRNGIRLR